ncbi:SEC-C metal-binding domain-containing protein [Skermanella aerolata]|uniref:SEC-C metal-binding domain-containing protein n=1 Tax=Skermanella aerolata TaxID=393310 RepID=UPI0009FCDC60
MVKRSRVALCPCGSGRKRKNCHRHIPFMSNVSGMYRIQDTRKVAYFTNDILVN